jgi:murein DD-endopeptidase MepM/ murein hydrolase activator NlpD
LYIFQIVGPCGKSFKIRIPRLVLLLLAGCTLIGAGTAAIMVKSYARMLVKVSNYNRLRAERETLNTKYHLLETVVRHTNTKLNSLENLASEVAESYGLERPFSKHFPARRDPPGFEDGFLDSRYDASLYAFNSIERASWSPVKSPLLMGLLSNPEIDPASIPSIWPVYGELTDGFGERMDPFTGEAGFHAGVDIAAPYGSPVRAAADGVVLQAGAGETGYGNAITIDHGSGLETFYCHLSKVDVVEGQKVLQGQVIGAIGTTGRTTGPHLHYEVLVNQTPVNPEQFLRG